MTHNEDVCGESVEVIKGDLENTNGDRGQICDFVIRKRGRADVKFTVTYTTTGVDASQSTNSLPAPLVSIVTIENDESTLHSYLFIADVKFTVTTAGVDASQSTNSLPAPLVSIVTVENDELKLE